MAIIFSSIIRAILWVFTVKPHNSSSPLIFTSVSNEVPGGSPLQFCHESHHTDLFSIDQIELVPNPLHIDDVFEVHLSGIFLQNITEHAAWNYLARYGNSTQYETGTMDFCSSLDSIDQPFGHGAKECPPVKGYAFIKMSAWVMPMFIVPGRYYFKFDAVANEGQRIYCLDAEIDLYYKGSGNDQDLK